MRPIKNPALRARGKLGLEILRIGRCVFIDPAKLTEFMRKQTTEAQ